MKIISELEALRLVRTRRKETDFLRMVTWESVPGGATVKNPPAKAGDAGDVSSIPGLGNSLELEMATYSSVLTC